MADGQYSRMIELSCNRKAYFSGASHRLPRWYRPDFVSIGVSAESRWPGVGRLRWVSSSSLMLATSGAINHCLRSSDSY